MTRSVASRALASALLLGALSACGPRLPDWSGWWKVEQGQSPTQIFLEHADLFQPEARRRIEAVTAPGANLSANGVYCRLFRFVGDNGGQIEDVEFLLTPGRLTITNESGLLRRIPFDGTPLRADPEPSNGGTSAAHWEGGTLVIETVGLHPDTTFPAPTPGAPLIGAGARINERIRLIDSGKLEVRSEIIAPQMLTAPLNLTTVYRRDPGHIVRDLDECDANDRSIDPQTGLQRFDLTPPADLPPPPP